MDKKTRYYCRITRDGAIEHEAGLTTFALYAPEKASVHLIGDFNGWDHDADPMQRRGDDVWVAARQLSKGQYAYKFLIDGVLTICDPYARQVEPDPLDPKQPRAVVHVGRAPYCWRNRAWWRPRLDDLIICEIHIADFSPEGTFRGLAARLDYLHHLGINALELLPVQEAPTGDYWGYQPTYYMAPRAIYGSYEELQELIDEAHARSMAVLLDVAFAHTSWSHPFQLMYDRENSPWYGKPLGRENEFEMPALSFKKPATMRFLYDVQKHWLTEFHIDGFRYDYIASIAKDDEGAGVPWLVKSAREVSPDVYCIGEWLPEEPEEASRLDLDAVWHGSTVAAMHALVQETAVKEHDWNDFKRAIDVLDYDSQGYKAANFMINYVESHDENRVINGILCAGFDEATAYRKAALLATVLLTAAGEPMLYAGQEWGEPTGRLKNEPNKLHWELLESSQGAWLRRHVRRMCWLRRGWPALARGLLEVALVDPQAKCTVWHRTYGAQRAVVALNFSGGSKTLRVPFSVLDSPQPRLWHEYFSSQVCDVSEPHTRHLFPYSAQLFFPVGNHPVIEREPHEESLEGY